VRHQCAAGASTVATDPRGPADTGTSGRPGDRVAARGRARGSSVSVGDPEASGYEAFRDGVTDVMQDGRHDLEAAATARQRRYTLLAVAAAVVAIVAFVVVVMAAGAVARSRTPRPHPT